VSTISGRCALVSISVIKPSSPLSWHSGPPSPAFRLGALVWPGMDLETVDTASLLVAPGFL
jgi:hypothetical protein